jgi:predicted ArsR family transcriptional regulator
LRARKYLRHNDVVKRVGLAGTAPGAEGGAGRSAASAQAMPRAAAQLGTPAQLRTPVQFSTPAQPGSERGTRGRIARLILENGPATAAGLSARLGLTPAAVRRHLDNLQADGMIETRIARTYGSRGRGRPARLFVITDSGRSAFENAYDDLATSALRFLAETAGPAAVAEFARRQVADLEARYRPAVDAAPADGRVQALADALSADGYAASASGAPRAGQSAGKGTRAGASAGEQLCQHHCPVAHVAAEFPQLCEAETEAFGRLLGTPVQRLATIAHGDGICTTHVTAPALAHVPGSEHRPNSNIPGSEHRPSSKHLGNTTTEPGGISA